VNVQVLQPVRSLVLGDYVEPALVFGEPDLNLTGTTALATSGGEIEILLAGDVTGL
jgi:hypothetical protein